MKIVKEITEWQADYRQPNHTYLINAKNQIVAYAKWHSKTDIMVFKSRSILDKKYRKFEEVKHAGLSKIAKQFPEENEKQKEETITPSENVRVFNVKTNDKVYTVTFNKISKTVSCGCIGYGYRRKCRHSEAVKSKLGV